LTVLVVDNGSPFTADILQCLKKIGVSYDHKKCTDLCGLFKDGGLKNDKVILSGRQKNDRQINVINSGIVRHCFDADKPILGICYGAEIIALALGGSIRRMPQGHLQGRTSINVSANLPILPKKRSLDVYESHGFCVARLPEDFVSAGRSESCPYEIFAHRKKKIYGTQFHPEKSWEDGMAILANFARLE
jgi:GMP synthase (glutamine-hydrolysing)